MWPSLDSASGCSRPPLGCDCCDVRHTAWAVTSMAAVTTLCYGDAHMLPGATTTASKSTIAIVRDKVATTTIGPSIVVVLRSSKIKL
ncbi:hypothetical protein GW17_00050317 [Ensete ventricosum]|nr:hypothetical protein GW17_00050317 [Ensete ventricosum]